MPQTMHKKLQSILDNFSETDGTLTYFLKGADPFELAEILFRYNTEQKVEIFRSLPEEKRQTVLYETDEESRAKITELLGDSELADLLAEMPEDEAADILQEFEEDKTKELLEKMPEEEAGELKDLLQYEEETAGGLMVPNFNKAFPSDTAADVIHRIKTEKDKDAPPYFYITNAGGQLQGYFKLRDLFRTVPGKTVEEFKRKELPLAHLNDSCKKVAETMDNNHVSAVPVVDDDNIIRGVITFDDVIAAVMDLADDDIYKMVGTSSEPLKKKMLRKVRHRIPWLFATLVGGIASAMILNSFEPLMVKYAAVIFFIPFVIGLSGNIAIQGSTVLVRGLATGEVRPENLSSVIISEIGVGGLNGLIFGVVCGLLVAFLAEPVLHTTPLIGLTVGTGLVLSVWFASIMGSVMPVIFQKLDFDPAISASPMITIVNDVLGVFVYLATSMFLLGRFG